MSRGLAFRAVVACLAMPMIVAAAPERPRLRIDFLEEALGRDKEAAPDEDTAKRPVAPKSVPKTAPAPALPPPVVRTLTPAPANKAAVAKPSVAKPAAAMPIAAGVATEPPDIETETGGRLGIALVDARGKLLIGFNRDDSFPMCSTFKGPLAAAIVMGAEKGRFGLEGTMALRKEDVLDYAPVVKANLVRGRLSIGELAAAAVEVSDNSAANILLPLVGGPQGLTSFVRAHGDSVTRFDRTEPTLNENAVDDPRDTTSPAAMATLMARLLLQDMPTGGAKTLRGWLEASKTGGKRIRAGVPQGWTVGDKTGSCGTSYGDVAVLRSPKGNDYVLAIYLDRPTVGAAQAESAIARAATATLEVMNYVAQSQAQGPPEDGPPAPVAAPPRERAGPPDIPQTR